MTEFETKLVAALNRIADGLESVSTSIEGNSVDHRDLQNAATSIEQGLASVAESIAHLEINR